MIKICERYGDISEEAFKNLKVTKLGDIELKIDVKFKRLIEFPDSSHNISYFNNRRVEMLPPNFVDSKTNEKIRLHEIDNYIETELYLNKKLRASKGDEPGDLFYDSTGLSYDTMGIPHNLPSKMIGKPPKSYDTWLGDFNPITEDGQGYLKSIAIHFNKINKIPPLNFVVIDYKYLEELSLSFNKPSNHLREITDQFISQYFNSYNTNLIKLNY